MVHTLSLLFCLLQVGFILLVVMYNIFIVFKELPEVGYLIPRLAECNGGRCKVHSNYQVTKVICTILYQQIHCSELI